MVKKLVAVVMVFSIVMMPSVFAFSFMGIDFGALWDKIVFWKDKNEVAEGPATAKSTSSSSSKPSAPKPEVYVTLGGVNYTQSALKSTFASNEELQGYVKGFGYDCVYVATDKDEKFTLSFDTSKGTLKSVKKGNSCPDKEIYMEDSLIVDITRDGFSGKKIKSYLERVDLPWSMYAKALKVFTVG